ncbi:MAG: hypothetical protein ACTHMQ_03620 [Protaetiibacter sp.]
MTNYKDAFAAFLAAQKDAVKFTNPNFTNSAVTRERYKRLQDARNTLRDDFARITTLSTAGDPQAALAAAFETLAARDADSVAVASNEWGKVRAMLDSGRNLGQIIDNADRRRLSAILDHAEELGIQAQDVEGVVAEVQSRVLDRLAGLGEPTAQAALEAVQQARYQDAWQAVATETLEGRLTIGSQSALFNAAPNEYRETIGADDPDSFEIGEAVAHLDRLAPSLEQS